MDSRELAEQFLADNQFQVYQHSPHEFIQNLQKQAELGLNGKQSTLIMSPAFVESKPKLDREEFLLLDMGGTNLRLGRIKNGELESYQPLPMLGRDSAISKEEFFLSLARLILPQLVGIRSLKCCLSYPFRAQPDGEARVLKVTKENKISNIENALFRKELKIALSSIGYTEKLDIFVFNDTVATLLAGYSFLKNYDSYLGVVVGTGFNIAYIERSENIAKLPAPWQSSPQIINTEVGGYMDVVPSYFDEVLDNHSYTPGEYRLEKMVSGAYLGSLALVALKTAQKAGLFQEQTTRELILNLDQLSTETINQFLLNDRQSLLYQSLPQAIQSTHDLEVIYFIIHSIVERSIYLCSLSIASFALKTGRGKSPLSPICITVDGSSINKLKNYTTKLYYYLRQTLDIQNTFFEIKKSDNGVVAGVPFVYRTNADGL